MASRDRSDAVGTARADMTRTVPFAKRESLNMKIEFRKISDIIPYEHNPRINDAAVDAVARSIQEFGFRQPIVVDTDGVIVVGHTRWKAAKKLGLETVPVHVATELTPEQIRAYRIADNRPMSCRTGTTSYSRQELSALQELGL